MDQIKFKQLEETLIDNDDLGQISRKDLLFAACLAGMFAHSGPAYAETVLRTARETVDKILERERYGQENE